ncbi:uncharacterized protein LOC113308770 [Papaver somniferum]|uniref:uncharacterized protein LOC113308770 n=1 Tax=Papaver somniferum TaxID=3469 RepID=UPI000E70277E|nr:uncharacterized protein LOC113308770 [Papaver somniferum]
MPRTTRSSGSSNLRNHHFHSTDSTPEITDLPLGSPPPSQPLSVSQRYKFHLSFKNFDDCTGGIGGREYAKSAIFKHLKDRHFPDEASSEVCRERIKNNVNCFVTWERVLNDMQGWLCIKCLRIHAWRMTCRSQIHPAEDIAGPFNGLSADFLIHGAEKPQVESPVTVDTTETNTPVVDDVAAGLTVELLNNMLRKQITTTVSIPPPSRLHFSRALKSALDYVLASPKNLAAWIQLLLLPTCTLNSYEPKSSREERSGNKRKLQIDAINRDFMCWKEPSGCFNLA